MKDRIKIEIIGATGFIGELHTRAVFEIPSTKLIAIVNINEERGKRSS